MPYRPQNQTPFCLRLKLLRRALAADLQRSKGRKDSSEAEAGCVGGGYQQKYRSVAMFAGEFPPRLQLQHLNACEPACASPLPGRTSDGALGMPCCKQPISVRRGEKDN